jgi:mono/diheme cytochrome c family protein
MNTNVRWIGPGLLAAALLMAGCGESTPEAKAPTAPATPAASAVPAKPAVDKAALHEEAEEIFSTRCQTCHGARGAGNGPGSAALDPKPRNFQDPEWQSSVNDDHIAKIIQYGGAAVGKSPAMPSNPDLSSKPELVSALVGVVRELGER